MTCYKIGDDYYICTTNGCAGKLVQSLGVATIRKKKYKTYFLKTITNCNL